MTPVVSRFFAQPARYLLESVVTALVLLGIIGQAFSQEKPKQIEFKRAMRPDRAVAIALEDCKALVEADPQAVIYSRWVMFNEPVILEVNGKEQDVTRAGLSHAVNTALLHGATIFRPYMTADRTVYRLDLAQYAEHEGKTLQIILDTWERMTDNQFYLPTGEKKLLNSPRYKFTDGKVYSAVYGKKIVPAAHADINGQLSELCKLTYSQVPIISAGQFLRFAMNSDFGGLYPEFRNFDISPEKGTAEEAFLLRAGVDLKVLGARNSDQRVVCMGKPTANIRLVEYVPAAITRPAVGPVIATITRDYFSGKEVDPNNHPIENLADRKHDGTEIFLPTTSGGLEYALFQGNGDFVRSAPLNPPNSLAWDSTLPQPFLPVLQGPSGCIRCHINQNSQTKLLSIYQPAPNFVTWLRDVTVSGQRFDVFDDKGVKSAEAKARLDRLVSLYNGETSEAFTWAGRTYAKFAFECSNIPLEFAANSWLKVHDQWLYSYVTPKRALLTLGYKVENELEAVEVFNQICPPAPEPLRITQLRAWKNGADGQLRELPLTVDDFLAVYPEIALRISKWEEIQGTQPLPVKADP